MTYNKTGMKAISIIRECFNNLQEKHPKVFNKTELVCSYKRNKNIAEHLVHAKSKYALILTHLHEHSV